MTCPGRSRRPKPKRGTGKKKQGKQPGAPGAHLAWSEGPDKREDLFPEGACACGRDLADADDLGVAASHQLIDTPAVTATVTQYDGHAVACRCGRVHAAAPPAGAGEAGTVTYGPNLQAWCVFLLVAHHVPVERCAGHHRGADRDPPVRRVRPLDDRPCREGRAGREHADPGAGDHRVGAVRGRDPDPGRARPEDPQEVPARGLHEPADLFLPRRPVHEDLRRVRVPGPVRRGAGARPVPNYDAVPGVLHQLCTQHVLRDLEDAAQSYPDAVWPGQAADALRALIHAANTARANGLAAVPDDDIAADLVLFRNAVRVGLSQVRRVPGANAKQKPGRCLLECLRDREADVLRFLGDLRIPPTSNQAERDLRPSKTQQKISGRLRSRPQPATATPSAATPTPPASTASMS